MKINQSIERQLRRYYRKTDRKLRLPVIKGTVENGDPIVLLPAKKNPFVSAVAFAIYFIGVVSMVLLIWNAGANRNRITPPESNPVGWAEGATDSSEPTTGSSQTSVPITTENLTSSSPVIIAPEAEASTPLVTSSVESPITTPDTTPSATPETTPDTTPVTTLVTTPDTAPVTTPVTTPDTTPVAKETVNLIASHFGKIEEDYSSMFGFLWDGGFRETPEKLFDGDPESKLCAYAPEALNQPIVWSMTQAVVVTRYSVTTANDNANFPGRNPLGWSLYGTNNLISNDPGDGSWTLLHSVKDANLPDENYYATYYEIDNTQAYQYYLLVFDELNLYQTGLVAVLTPEGEYTYDEVGNIVYEEGEIPKIIQLSEFTLYGYADKE